METWRLLHTWDRSPAFNMGLDDALLVRPSTEPTLRFYTWEPETLSLGYFQRVAEVPAVREAPAVCRRVTGGGAIYHAAELTFSIAVPEDHPIYAGPVRSSYERVHGAIGRVLAGLGVPAVERGEGTVDSDRSGTGMCFEDSTHVDLVWGRAKGVGSAQRRAKGRVLHHGSIKLGRSRLDPSVAAVWDHRPGLELVALAEALAAELAERFALRLEEGEAETEEVEHAHREGERYVSDEFVNRR